ncbi:MAG: hypothetical protein ACO23B_07395 [Burkholderiaceae bacterium]|nr:hypothetical protein [Oxalobacteraceae bacterium]
MKISLLLTPRLVVIISACGTAVVLLLLMLGFELGLRQAHEDYAAQAKARGEPLYDANAMSTGRKTASSGTAAPGTASSNATTSGTTQGGATDSAGSSSMSRGTP